MTDSARIRRTIRGTAMWAVLLVLAVSCGDPAPATGPVTPGTASVLAAPVIESFSADPAEITDGGESELSWVVDDPTARLKITPLRSSIDGTTITVRPVVTTIYTLTATNAFGATRTSVTVSVIDTVSVTGTGTDGSTDSTDSTDSTGEPGGDQYASTWVDAAAGLEGLPSECGNLSFVSSNPNEDMMIAGVAQQGLWSITAGSDTWERMGQGAFSAQIVNRTSSIVYDPDDPNVFWESGFYNEGGVYKTVDKGVTFTQLGDVTHSDLVAIDFTDPQRLTMLSGTHERNQLFLTTDGGTNWADISAALPSNIGFANSPLVMDSQTFLLGTMRGADSAGVFRTTDGGATWALVFPEGVKGRPLVTSSDGAIYWLLDASDGMIASTDGGLNWVKAPGTGPRSVLSTSLVELADGRIAAIGGSYIVATADKGETWQRIGAPFPYEPNGLAYSPYRNAFFAWRFDCLVDSDHPIAANAIVRLDPLDPLDPLE